MTGDSGSCESLDLVSWGRVIALLFLTVLVLSFTPSVSGAISDFDKTKWIEEGVDLSLE